MKRSLIEIRESVLQRMSDADFIGYDPSAIQFSRRYNKVRSLIRKVPTVLFRRILSSIFSRTIYYAGGLSVMILSPEKKEYAKGLALTLSGLSYDLKGKDTLVNSLVDRLLKKRVNGKFLWAHDLDYSFPGGKAVTTETPNLITTAFVANSFFDLYLKTGDDKYKDYLIESVNDLVETIPYKATGQDEICFMYTPVTDYHVHNANLLYCEMLAKKCYLEDSYSQNLINLIESALRYSLRDFENKKNYPYAGEPTPNNSVDNYHTGYLIRSLYEIDRLVGAYIEFDLKEHINKLVDFYIDRFVGEDYIYRDAQRTVQSHSLAESILIYCMFSGSIPVSSKSKYRCSIFKTIDLLYSDKGFFINNVKFWGGIKIYDRTEMIRWSNAWMFYALSVLGANQKDGGKDFRK